MLREIMGKSSEPVRRPAKPQPVKLDPEQVGSKLAREAAQEEARAKNARLKASTEGRDEFGRTQKAPPRKPVGLHRRRRPTVDQTLILDSEGQRAGTPGMVQRWVRTRDDLNRQTSARMADYTNYGYVPILDPHTGEPISSHLGVAMECDPASYAERMLDYMPDGALDKDALLEATEIAVENFNAQAGGRMARLVKEDQHGSHRQAEEVVPAAGFDNGDGEHGDGVQD